MKINIFCSQTFFLIEVIETSNIMIFFILCFLLIFNALNYLIIAFSLLKLCTRMGRTKEKSFSLGRTWKETHFHLVLFSIGAIVYLIFFVIKIKSLSKFSGIEFRTMQLSLLESAYNDVTCVGNRMLNVASF